MQNPNAMTFDASGNLYVSNGFGDTTVTEFAAGATHSTATLTGENGPDALAVDAAGDLFVANEQPGSISEFKPGARRPVRRSQG